MKSSLKMKRTRLVVGLFQRLIERNALLWGGLTAFVMILSAVGFALAPLALSIWIDALPESEGLPAFFFIYISLYALGFLARDFQWLTFSHFEKALHTLLMGHLLHSSLNNKQESPGIGVISTTLQGVQSFLFCVIFIILPFGLETIGMLFSITGAISWKVGIGFAFFIAGFLFILNWSTERMSIPNRKLVHRTNETLDFFSELLRGRALLKRHEALPFANQALSHKVNERERRRIQFGHTRSLTTLLLNTWVVLALLLSLTAGILLYQNGTLSIGELAAMESFFFQIMRRLEVWARGYRESAVSADQCETLISWLERSSEPRADGREPSDQDVTPVPIHPQFGKWNTITGPTGSGKSTYLWSRYSENKKARSFLPQASEILPVSLKDNLTLGKNIPESKLNEVIEGLELNEPIKRLEYGLETILHPASMELSGGEQQRLCLARALLHQASDQEIQELILDEPTSAQSQWQEKRILRFLKEYTRGKTVISVTHRPAMASISDVTWHFESIGQAKEVEV